MKTKSPEHNNELWFAFQYKTRLMCTCNGELDIPSNIGGPVYRFETRGRKGTMLYCSVVPTKFRYIWPDKKSYDPLLNREIDIPAGQIDFELDGKGHTIYKEELKYFQCTPRSSCDDMPSGYINLTNFTDRVCLLGGYEKDEVYDITFRMYNVAKYPPLAKTMTEQQCREKIQTMGGIVKYCFG